MTQNLDHMSSTQRSHDSTLSPHDSTSGSHVSMLVSCDLPTFVWTVEVWPSLRLTLQCTIEECLTCSPLSLILFPACMHTRIRKISGLQTLIKLDVLDLHGNMVKSIMTVGNLGRRRYSLHCSWLCLLMEMLDRSRARTTREIQLFGL